ncbi:MAG: hypothetical protein OXF74_09835 [Rhodobacteraceae bacterium]|nr:hypothetical protein [Paracoccaceae bacterium]
MCIVLVAAFFRRTLSRRPVAFSLLLLSAAHFSDATFAQTCPGSEGSADSAGIQCGSDGSPIATDYVIWLENGLRILSPSGHGIHFIGERDISVRMRNPGHNVSVTGSDGGHGAYFQGRGTRQQRLSFSARDITSTGDAVRVVGLTGTTDIRVTGEIKVSGACADADDCAGVFVRLADPSPVPDQVTRISVHDVESTKTGEQSAGIFVDNVGRIEITSTGRIYTTGDAVSGVRVLHQTRSGTDPGSVDVTVHDIETRGEDAYAVTATRFSDSDNPKSPVMNFRVTGEVITKGLRSHGLALEGPDAEFRISITESGSVTVLPEQDAKAIIVTDAGGSGPIGSVKIENRGTVTGEVYAEACLAPEFSNWGRFNSHNLIDLIRTQPVPAQGCTLVDRTTGLTSGRLTNHGIISPGGEGTINRTVLTGDLRQTGQGIIQFDIDWAAGEADFFEILGRADLAGFIKFDVLSDVLAIPVKDSGDALLSGITVLTASGGIQGSLDSTNAGTVILNHSVELNDSLTALSVVSFLDLNPDGLNRNQLNVLAATYASHGESDGFASVMRDLIGETRVAGLRHSLDGLGNEIAGASIQRGLRAVSDFNRNPPTCSPSESRGLLSGLCIGGGTELITERQPGIFDEGGRQARVIRLDAVAIRHFKQFPSRLELALQLDRNSISADSLARSKGNSQKAALRILQPLGRFELSASAALQRSEFNISRQIPYGNSVSTGELRMMANSLQAAATYRTDFRGWQVTPGISVSQSKFSSKPYIESGAGDFSLHVTGSRGKSFEISAGVGLQGSDLDFAWLSGTPVMEFSWKRRNQNPIETDSRYAGSEESFRTTTSPAGAEINADMALNFRTRNQAITGAAGLSYARGVTKGWNALAARLGLIYQF